MPRIDRSDREFLKKAIQAARDFEQGRAPYSLEIFLFDLHETDQSKNKDLWNELLQALCGNSHLHQEAVIEFFDRPYFVKEGYWWWNTDKWLSDEWGGNDS